jgi:hypothetical protein
MNTLRAIGYLYVLVSALIGTYEIIYLRFVTCTEKSILGFFWCPETANPLFISVKALLWPVFYLL